jgi:glycosyltransferase involved in cell wall biosynthesis
VRAVSREAVRVGIIVLVPDSWWSVPMPRHQVCRRLRKHFEVVWVEPAWGWREHWLPGGKPGDVMQDVQGDAPGFTVFDPGRWLPEVYRPQWLGDALRRRRVRVARRMLEARGCTHIVLYLWRPDFDWALDVADADLSCYHIDDEYNFSIQEQPNDPRELRLLGSVDQVFIHSRKLFEKKGSINPHTLVVPNGVDYPAYSTPCEEPADLARIPHPRMGYVGVVKAQLDIGLMCQLAERRPQWSFVIVGPPRYLGDKATAYEELCRLPNVYALGNRQLPDLPSYTQHMDVCMMFYEVNDYTNFIYPLKLNEYLATGRPVVSTPIDSVLPFADVVQLATTPDEWEVALDRSLLPPVNSPAAARARQARAAENDWDRLADRVAEQMRLRLRERRGVEAW